MKLPVLLGVAFAIAVVGFLIFTSFGNRKVRCQVCVTYEGRNACRIASAATREAALRSATDNACAQIVSGVTATMACTGAPPVSVRWLPH